MKLLTLRLLAFGPFEKRVLDFGPSSQSLQVIYGANEAGKSSALRAIRQALYGIAQQTPDNFRFDYNKLRVGAVLEHSDGRLTEFVRRKAKSQTLRAADDQTPLPDNALADWIGHVSAEMFSSTFGIDQPTLRKGGQQLISGEGDLGKALFAAASGLTSLKTVQTDFQKRLDQLYVPTGKNQQIANLLRQLNEGAELLRKVSTSPGSWQALENRRNELLQQRETLLRDKQACGQRHEVLNRYRNALTLVTRWRETQAKLEIYVAVPTLKTSVRQTYDELFPSYVAEQRRVAALREQQEQLGPHAELSPAEAALIADQQAIQLVRDLWGSNKKALADRVHRIREREALDAQIDLKSKELIEAGWSNNEEIVITNPQRKRWDALTELHTRLQTELRLAQTELQMAQQEQSQLPTSPSSTPTVSSSDVLEELAQSIRAEGKLEDQHAAQAGQLATLLATIDRQLRQLPYWTGTVAELEGAVWPTNDWVRQQQVIWQELRTARDEAGKAVNQLEKQQRKLTRELVQLEREGAVPLLADLKHLRLQRDTAWSELQTAWTSGSPAPHEDLAGFTSLIAQADQLADQLRTAAENVARKTALLHEEFDLKQQLQEALNQQQKFEQAFAVWEQTWQAHWPALSAPPGDPPAMLEWLSQQSSLMIMLHEQRQQEATLRVRHQTIDRHRQDLLKGMSEAGYHVTSEGSLSYLLTQAEVQIKQQRAARKFWEHERNRAEQLQRRLSAVNLRLEQLQAEELAWQNDWQIAMATLKLEKLPFPDQLTELLRAQDTLSALRSDRAKLQERIDGIDHDYRTFSAELTALCQRHQIEFRADKLETTCLQLFDRLSEAQTADRLHTEKQLTHKRISEELVRSQFALQSTQSRLEILCQQAGVSNFEDLPAALDHADEKRRLQQLLETTEEDLSNLRERTPLSEFVAEVEAHTSASISNELAQLADRQTQSQQLLDDLNQQLFETEAKRKESQGTTAAVQQAQNNQSLLVELEEAAREYMVLKLAQAALRIGIERYRTRNQGPLLSRASRLFSQLTNQRYEGLDSDTDEKGEPILLCVRQDQGEKVPLSGLSDGTGDQVYLALRIAALEAWLEHHEPMPLIVDDILLHFDDDRAAAALQVLGELSRRTQVLFFTHHKRLAELAQAHVPSDLLKVQEL